MAKKRVMKVKLKDAQTILSFIEVLIDIGDSHATRRERAELKKIAVSSHHR